MEAITDKEKLKLYKVRKTVIEMLQDRGYVIPKEKINETYDEFKDKLESNSFQLVAAKDSSEGLLDDNKIYVIFPSEEKIAQDHITEYVKKLDEQNVFRCILIVRGKITPGAEKSIREFESTLTIETFHESELLVNITRHEYVPKHVLLSNDEKKELLKRYKVKDHQLPKILKGDAVSRYLGLKRGNVVKIIRNSETAGKYITYRLCI